MATKKYFATADTTITNAFRSNLRNRGTDANMGASDIMEVFSIYGQASSTSTELSRLLVRFPINKISANRTAGLIPASGSVNFFLNLTNARSSETVPRDLQLNVYAVSRSWQEGTGLDMIEYEDVVAKGDIGATWMSASSTEAWTRMGGDYHSTPLYTQTFDKGTENLQIDVTPLVEQWISSAKANYGFGVHLSPAQQAYYSGSLGQDSTSTGQLNNLSGSKTSYYTKKFFARESEFFFKRPALIAKWDSVIKDQRGDFYSSSSMLPASQNNRSLYLYNYINGQYYDIPAIGTGSIYVNLYSKKVSGSLIRSTVVGTRVSRGIYQATFALNTSASVVYDRWQDAGATDTYYTGSINIKTYEPSNFNPYPNYVTSLTNLRPIYYSHETARFRFYIRQKDWCPTIYTVAKNKNDTLTIQSASYQIHRVIDDQVIIPFDTGSTNSTGLSYDVSGNYFDLDMKFFDPGYAYAAKVAFYDYSVQSYVEQPYEWKFRVEKLETK